MRGESDYDDNKGNSERGSDYDDNKGNSERAVSYTHLTLPTMYCV